MHPTNFELLGVYIKRFKSLIGPTFIDTTGISVLCGPNSAGKSAVIDAIKSFQELDSERFTHALPDVEIIRDIGIKFYFSELLHIDKEEEKFFNREDPFGDDLVAIAQSFGEALHGKTVDLIFNGASFSGLRTHISVLVDDSLLFTNSPETLTDFGYPALQLPDTPESKDFIPESYIKHSPQTANLLGEFFGWDSIYINMEHPCWKALDDGQNRLFRIRKATKNKQWSLLPLFAHDLGDGIIKLHGMMPMPNGIYGSERDLSHDNFTNSYFLEFAEFIDGALQDLSQEGEYFIPQETLESETLYHQLNVLQAFFNGNTEETNPAFTSEAGRGMRNFLEDFLDAHWLVDVAVKTLSHVVSQGIPQAINHVPGNRTRISSSNPVYYGPETKLTAFQRFLHRGFPPSKLREPFRSMAVKTNSPLAAFALELAISQPLKTETSARNLNAEMAKDSSSPYQQMKTVEFVQHCLDKIMPSFKGYELFPEIQDVVGLVDGEILARAIYLRVNSPHAVGLGLDAIGSGLSYALPVLASLAFDELSITEQPELHLHPRAQSEIADAYVAALNNGTKSLLETHSEYVILRLLRRIRETTQQKLLPDELRLNPQNLHIYYFKSHGNWTEIYRIEVDKHGDFLQPWPDGFFAERETDLFS